MLVLCAWCGAGLAGGPSFNYFNFAVVDVEDTATSDRVTGREFQISFETADSEIYQLGLLSGQDARELFTVTGGAQQRPSSEVSLFWQAGVQLVNGGELYGIVDLGGRLAGSGVFEIDSKLNLYVARGSRGAMMDVGVRAFVLKGVSLGVNLSRDTDDFQTARLSVRFE